MSRRILRRRGRNVHLRAMPSSWGATFLVVAILSLAIVSTAAADYRDTILVDGPSAYWRFNESTGTAAADETANANDGTYFNGATLGAAGAIPDSTTAVSLDGSNDYVKAANASSLNPNSGITLEAWVKPTSGGFGTVKPIVVKGYTSHTSPYYQYALAIGDVGTTYPKLIEFDVTIGGTRQLLQVTNSGWQYGVWNHLVATYDGANMRIYRNGTQVGSKAQTGSLTSYATPVDLGCFENLAKSSTYCFKGVLDEAEIYPSALTTTEISAHYQATSSTLPVNATLPTISGTPAQGATLTAAEGTWSNSPTSYTYQWRRCNSLAANCSDISGATSSTYGLTASDVDKRIRIAVTATNGAGSGIAESAASVTIQGPPANTALPVISGVLREDQTLSATTGAWTGSPTGYAYQWRRCDAVGANCSDISGATSSTYVLTAADADSALRVVVTASNAAGSAQATSAATGTVLGRPVNSVAPSLSGTTLQTWTQTATSGSWSHSPTSYTYQWLRCDAAGSNCYAIGPPSSALDANTYVLDWRDIGRTVRARVVATNAAGSTSADSAPTSSSVGPADMPNVPPCGVAKSVDWQFTDAIKLVCDTNGQTLTFRRTRTGGWYSILFPCIAINQWPWNSCGGDGTSYDGIGAYLSFRKELWKMAGPNGWGDGGLIMTSVASCGDWNSVPCFKRGTAANGVPIGRLRAMCQDNIHANDPGSCLSDPIQGATGGFRREETDLSLPGIGLPLSWTRTYNSEDATEGPFGPGWSFSYGARLSVRSSGDVDFHAENGQAITYLLQGDGSFAADGAFSKLVAVSGGYELTRHDQVEYDFDSAGRLTAMQDRNGQGIAFSYDGDGWLDGITDSAGREGSVSTNSYGLITAVQLPDSREVNYGYTDGRLSSVTDLRGGTTAYTYTSDGWLATVVDANNHTVVQNTYDLGGRVTQQVDPLNKTTTFSWNPTTETLTTTDARNKVWKDVYAGGELVERIDPLDHTTHYDYDSDFNLTSVEDARGNTTTMTYDSRGNLLTKTPPSPFTFDEEYTYDSANNLLTETNGRGYSTSYGYDTAGNLTSITRPGDTETTMEPDSTGLVTSVTDPRGKATSYEYDADGNLTAIETPLGKRTTMTYDGSGRMISRVDPRGNVTGAEPDDYRTSFTYDDADHLLTVTDPLDHVAEFHYDDVGNRTEVVDANEHATQYEYDAADRLKKVIAPDTSIVTQYAYDDVGNLVTRTDPNTHVTTYGYDDADHLTSVDLPGSRTWTYEYDENGNRTQTMDANGNATTGDASDGITTLTYDELNRLTVIDYSDSTPDVAFAYDENGNRMTMDDGAGTQTYAYDALDRLESVTRGDDVFSYGYDDAGNVTSRTYPGGRQIDYAYTDDGQLDAVTSEGATTSYGYDEAGNLETTTLPSGNGYVESRAYDQAGRLTGVENAKGGTALSYADYGLDPVGNPETITTDEDTQTYAYDSLDRLTEVCYQSSCPGGSDPFIRWTYDSVGNRLTEARPAGTTSYSYNSADELTSRTGLGGNISYAYEENGNETQAGGRTFAYDLANRLASTTLGGTTTDYAYDGDGVRLEADDGTSATHFLWDVQNAVPQLALERDGSGGALRTYVRGPRMISMDAGSSTSYFHYDGLGSVVNLTSDSGDPEWGYSYEPFGTPRTETQDDPSAPDNVLRFGGELKDDTGLYHLRARQYDSSTGRFLSTDPLAPSAADPYVSSYLYANNRPGVLIDPSGMGAVWHEEHPCASMISLDCASSLLHRGWSTVADGIQAYGGSCIRGAIDGAAVSWYAGGGILVGAGGGCLVSAAAQAFDQSGHPNIALLVESADGFRSGTEIAKGTATRLMEKYGITSITVRFRVIIIST